MIEHNSDLVSRVARVTVEKLSLARWPALFTRMSRPPSCATVAATAASHSASTLTSQRRLMTSPAPASRHSAFTASSEDRVRPSRDSLAWIHNNNFIDE